MTTADTTEPRASIRKAFDTYSKEIALVGTFFVLTLTLANFVHRVFGIALLPFFQATFEAFHKWCHIVLHVLIFSWVTALAEWCWYGITWVGSLLLPIVAWKPNLVIPPLVSDISLVSVAFTRVLSSTDLIVPRDQRREAEGAMTPEQWEEIQKLEGRIWGPIHRFLERLNNGIWRLIERLQALVPVGRFPRVRSIIRAVLIGFGGCHSHVGLHSLGRVPYQSLDGTRFDGSDHDYPSEVLQVFRTVFHWRVPHGSRLFHPERVARGSFRTIGQKEALSSS